MPKLTVLQIVQRALSAINSDNVTSISDTVESEQVKLFLDSAYEELLDDFPWHHLGEFGTLEVTATAHVMKIPNTVRLLDDEEDNQYGIIRYNDKDVFFISPERMDRILSGRDISLSTVDSNGALNNRDPLYWTTEDDENIIFDSYDGTLASVNSRAKFIRQPSVLTNDTDVPDLPDILHIVLQHRVFEDAFRLLKGDEQSANVYNVKYIKGLAKAKRWARRLNKKTSTYQNNYGRRFTNTRREISTRNVVEGS